MSSAQIIVLVTPLFLLLIALEWWIGRRRGRNSYRLGDTLASVGLGVMSQLVGVMAAVVTLGSYALVYEHAALWQLPTDSLWVWAGALLLYDFLYYWLHRFGHTKAVLWAAHAVHHQSEHYNLSTALRQTSTGWLFGWIFYLPMAVIGVPPLVFAVVGLIDLLYQFWVHTEQIGRLGWFDRWFCSPSNHRVHHAVNDPYLDRNYGGILIVWDRLFGTFQDELDAEPCVYGTRDALHHWNPLVANAQVYGRLIRKMSQTPRWMDKLRLWWAPAHWPPPGVPVVADPAFDPQTRRRFEPALSSTRQRLAVAAFVFLLSATAAILWHAQQMSAVQQAASLALVTAGLCGVAWLCMPRTVAN